MAKARAAARPTPAEAPVIMTVLRFGILFSYGCTLSALDYDPSKLGAGAAMHDASDTPKRGVQLLKKSLAVQAAME
jgi:hypothetical protein